MSVSGRSLRVLAVDDDPLVLMNTIDLLEDLGHRAVSASNGADALKMIGKGDFDVLVSDHAMPGMTGIQLAISALKVDLDLKIVIATGYAELPEKIPAGLVRISKPFTQSTLAAALERVFAAEAGHL